ncbi:hypothetical protein QBC40DRAFT_285934 [Triangularia verruculosa]|uniref:Carboxylesterase family protein n=1 Tax=Triangularia verruculosa TaxID=2587418 RepID=A0AAN7AS74_9PEZI|nr:hypothetical protein QBC40DRAFT_285934 [Triangularia verruculosa]
MMATTSRLRSSLAFDIHTDHTHHSQKASLLSSNKFSVLGDIPLNSVQNLNSNNIDALTRDLDNLHLEYPSKETHQEALKAKGHRVRLSIGDNTEYDHPFFDKNRVASGNTTISTSITTASDDFKHTNPLAKARNRLCSNLEQIRKHQEATRVESEEESVMEQAVVVEKADSVIANTSQDEGSTILRGGNENLQPKVTKVTQERPKSALSIKVDETLMGMDHLSPLPSPQPARPLSRIEDSVEELDKLEEELEALNEVAQLDRVVSPDHVSEQPVLESIPEAAVQQPAPPSTRRASTVRGSTSSTHTTIRNRSTAERSSSSVRKSASAASSAREDDKVATFKTTANTSTARRSIARPSSLLPPKATVKSSRAPTVPAFELPGEAVARRLKEQRAARLSQQVSAEEAAAIAARFSPSKPHVKSTKPVTKPTFELPGEAISRRKREEREARLKAQEEEERKRREFKARPIRASVIGSSGGSAVRETATSRARQARMEAAAANANGQGGATTPTHGSSLSGATGATSASAARKRHSIAGGYASSTVAASTRSFVTTTTTTRGRTLLAAAAPVVGSASRGTSTTSASSNGKRSSVSVEEVQQQKMRGKEIFKRDNAYTTERERERKEREQAAKVAREQAAERSRALGREWKEKMAVRQKRWSSRLWNAQGGQGCG